MMRTFFLAIGVYVCLLGLQCLAVDKFVLRNSRITKPGGAPVVKAREITPPEWAPWSLLSAGAVVSLYTFTLPKKAAAK